MSSAASDVYKRQTQNHNNPRKNQGSKISDIACSNFLFDISPQAREAKEKINKFDYIKLNNFCAAKETINKTKRQSTEWEKIFNNYLSNKGLISPKKKTHQKNPIKKMGKKP